MERCYAKVCWFSQCCFSVLLNCILKDLSIVQGSSRVTTIHSATSSAERGGIYSWSAKLQPLQQPHDLHAKSVGKLIGKIASCSWHIFFQGAPQWNMRFPGTSYSVINSCSLVLSTACLQPSLLPLVPSLVWYSPVLACCLSQPAGTSYHQGCLPVLPNAYLQYLLPWHTLLHTWDSASSCLITFAVLGWCWQLGLLLLSDVVT